LFEKYGQGATHAQYSQVERLFQLQYTAAGIILVDEPPIQLQLAQESRHWEGIARLDALPLRTLDETLSQPSLGL